jgi:predicted RNA-binding protein with EMAP domain
MWGNPDSLIKIDIEKIKEIKSYCQNPKYCIMSQETLKAIEHDLKYKKEKEVGGWLDKDRTIEGLTIAICENLEFGQFEIR